MLITSTVENSKSQGGYQRRSLQIDQLGPQWHVLFKVPKVLPLQT